MVGFTRRRLRIGALVAAASLLAGCGGWGETPTKFPTADREVGTATITKPATGPVANVTWALPHGEPASLDWIKSYDYSANTVLSNLCEGLVRQEPDLSLAPGLAASYHNPEPTKWVYELRDGVTFSDGKPMTAADVVGSLRRNLDPKLASYWAVPFYSNVKSVEQTGRSEVTVTLSRPDPLFNRMMATAAGAVGDMSYVEKAGSAYGTPSGGVMCTGPFALDRWDPGDRIVLKRNPDYWDTEHRAHVDRLTFEFVTDEATTLSALQTGAIDGMFGVPVASVPSLKSSSVGRLYLGKSTEWYAFRYTAKDGPAQDPRIRKALSLAVDRPAVAAVAFSGTAAPSLTPIQSAAWGYGRDVFAQARKRIGDPVQDIDRAKKLVQEAGSPDEPIEVAVPASSQSSIRSAEAIQAAGLKIGLDVELKTLPSESASAIFFDEKMRNQYDLMEAAEYGAGVADPIVSLSEFTPLSAYNYSDYDNPRVTGPVREAFKTADPRRRAKLLSKAELALVRDNAMLALVKPANVTFVNNRLTGAPVSLAYLYYPWAADLGASR